MSLKRIQVNSDTIYPIRNGHPWVYRSGIKDTPQCGKPVLLVDSKNKILAFGLGDDGDIAVRILGKNPDKIPDLLRKRIRLASDIRKRIIVGDTNAYRLINGAGDLLPGIVVDRYNDLLVLKLYSKAWEHHLNPILDALEALEGVTSIVRRYGVRKVDGESGIKLLSGPHPPDTLIIKEHGLKFIVRPSKGQKTGLFLDQREHRFFLGQRSQNLRVANLFAYTGGFSVYAAAGGAELVSTIDISAPAIHDAKENFKINGINPDKHHFETTDAFKWKGEHQLDLLICDPPSLSHKKKSDKQAMQAYKDLANLCAKQIPKGGLLATSSCTARLNFSRWRQAILQGVSSAGSWSWLWSSLEPPDHPVYVPHKEGSYLKFALLARNR